MTKTTAPILTLADILPTDAVPVETSQTVNFDLPDRPLIKDDNGSYHRVHNVNVRIDADGYTDVTFAGSRTKKDGTPHATGSYGRIFGVFLALEEAWVARAKEVLSER